MIKKISITVIIIAAFVFAINCINFVPANKYASVIQFNKIVGIKESAGLLVVAPWQQVNYYPKAYQIYDLAPSEVLTLDAKPMSIDSFCVWKIKDPMKYIQNLNGIDRAARRLDAAVYSSIKNTISTMIQQDIFTERDGAIDEKITAAVSAQMSLYGIEVEDVQIKQFSLPTANEEAVYKRMESERNRIAKQLIAEGLEEAVKVKNQADKEVKEILATANSNAAKLKAEGENEYMKIIQQAYEGADKANFYEFVRSMDALKVTMKGDKTIVLPYDSPIAKWLLSYKSPTEITASPAPAAE